MSEEQYVNYVNFKQCESLAFAKGKKSMLDFVEVYSNIDNLINLKCFVQDYTNHNFFDNFSKQNIYNLCSNIREQIDSTQIIDLINEIYAYLNTQKKDDSKQYYHLEYTKLFGDTSKTNTFDIEPYIDFIRSIKRLEFMILVSHSDMVTDEEFKKQYLNIFIQNSAYILCFYGIMSEEEKIILTSPFYERLMMILQNKIELLDKKSSKQYKKIKQKINNYRTTL